MKFLSLAPGAAFAALLLVGCSYAPSTDSTAERREGGGELARADLVRPPAVSDDANQVEADPLNDAGEIASEIESNTMIARVPVDGGLAWLQDGQVVRTASEDGHRIAYFYPGEERPFLVQDGRQAFAYRNGRAQLAYDNDGRPARVSDRARAEAQRVAAVSGRERDAAEQTLPEDRGRSGNSDD